MLSLGYLVVFRVVLRPEKNLRLSRRIENIPNGILTLDSAGYPDIAARKLGGDLDDFGIVFGSRPAQYPPHARASGKHDISFLQY
jgi:hypothetical protein